MSGNRDKSLVFVTVTHPDDVKNRSNQQSIRSRVMREIGMSRRTRKRPPVQIRFRLQDVSSITFRSACMVQDSYIPYALSSWPFPVALDSRCRELVHFMNSESDNVYRPFRMVWFSMALTEESAFKLSMANAAMFLAQKKDPSGFRYESCSESLEYYGQCLRLVTRKLEDPDNCVSEGVIVAVLGLICHDLYVGIWDRWAAHIAGLYRIHDLRGGFQCLDPNLSLFASWFDVLGCAVHDQIPHFSKEAFCYFESSSEAINPVLCQVLQQLEQYSDEMVSLTDTFRYIASLICIVDTKSKNDDLWAKEDGMAPLHLIGPVLHMLLSMPRLETTLQKGNFVQYLREVTRLAMLILVAEIKRVYSFIFTELDRLEAEFSGLVSKYSSFFREFFPHVQLWAVMTVAALRPRSKNRILYVHQIRRCMESLGVGSSEEAFGIVKSLVWADSIEGTTLDKSLSHAIDTTSPLLKESVTRDSPTNTYDLPSDPPTLL